MPLKLNPGKTELVWVASTGQWHHRPLIFVLGNDIIPLKCIRVLVTSVENDLQMMSYINRTVSTCFLLLCQIGQITVSQLRQSRHSWMRLFYQGLTIATVCLPAFHLHSMTSYNLSWMLQPIIFGRCKLMHITSVLRQCAMDEEPISFGCICPGWRTHFIWLCSLIYKALRRTARSIIPIRVVHSDSRFERHPIWLRTTNWVPIPIMCSKKSALAFYIAVPVALNNLLSNIRNKQSFWKFHACT